MLQNCFIHKSSTGLASHAGLFRGVRNTRDEIRAPLKRPAWEATTGPAERNQENSYYSHPLVGKSNGEDTITTTGGPDVVFVIE